MARWEDSLKEMKSNERQIGGDHYKSSIQHWDYVIANDLDYFQAQITKYVTRWKKKNGIKDLEKAQHFLEKYIETEVIKIKLSDAEKMPRGKIEQNNPFGFESTIETESNVPTPSTSTPK